MKIIDRYNLVLAVFLSLAILGTALMNSCSYKQSPPNPVVGAPVWYRLSIPEGITLIKQMPDGYVVGDTVLVPAIPDMDRYVLADSNSIRAVVEPWKRDDEHQEDTVRYQVLNR